MSNELDDDVLSAVNDLFYTMGTTQNDDTVDDDYAHFVAQISAGFAKRALALESFHLNINALTRMPKLLRLKPELTSMRLFDNMIADSGAHALHQILMSNPQMTYLDIGCNDLSDGSMICLIDMIRETKIEKLQLGSMDAIYQCNRFSREALSQIVDVMTEVDRLKCVGLSGVIGSRLRRNASLSKFSTYLGALIGSSKALRTLNAAFLEFDDSDQEVLAEGFEKNEGLRVLVMTGNSFPKGTKMIEGISHVRTLRSLNMARCNLGTPALQVLANELKNGWPLIELNLSGNKIGSDGVENLFDILADNETLVMLNLSQNAFDQTVAPALRRMFMKNQVIEDLDLSMNQLGDSALLVLSEFLGQNEGLISFSVTSCRVTDAGALAFAKAVVGNTTMKRIVMKDNFLSKRLGYELLEILQKNETLTRIEVGSNRIDCFVIDAIKKLCQRNVVLCKQRKLLPLKKAIIHLSIQKSKIPHLEDRLANIGDTHRELESANANIETNIDELNEKSQDELRKTRKEIQEIQKQINEEESAINEMTTSIEKMQRQTEAEVRSLKDKVIYEKERYEARMKEAEKIEAEIKAVEEETHASEQVLRGQIQKFESLIKEINEAMARRKTLRDYKIPEFPVEESPTLDDDVPLETMDGPRSSRRSKVKKKTKRKKSPTFITSSTRETRPKSARRMVSKARPVVTRHPK